MFYVDVGDNNVDQALRVLKKKMQREGLLREMRTNEFCEKPSVKKHGTQKRQLSVNAKPIACEPPKWAFEPGQKPSCIKPANQITH